MNEASQALEIRAAGEADEAAWERYVQAAPAATVFHRPAWSKAVEAAYGHLPLHLLAWRDGQVAGVLPLFLVKSIFVGKVLVSIPYATYGGIVSDGPEVSRALLAAGQELCRRHDAQYLELRHRDSSGLDLPVLDRYDTFRKALPREPSAVLEQLPRKTRAAARKGIEGLGPEAVSFGRQHLQTIYGLYAWTLRRLGSPNYRRELFTRLDELYGDDCVCLLVRDGGEPLAGVVSFRFRDELVPYFSGSTEAGMEKGANNVMYVRLMEHAVRSGLRWFDFNRTRRDNHGPHAFKRYHGFEPAPLHYQVSLYKATALPDLSPSNSKYKLAGRIWRKLPLWVTQRAGATISKWIP